MVMKTGVNREYKDRLFKFIFGNPENKEWTLSLYNAINGSAYTDINDIKFTTLDDMVYMSMKNDVSFLIDDVMNLYEQQSTYNPNMPIRFLIYVAMIYSKYIRENKSYMRYSSVQQKLPVPKCVCFYNGIRKTEEKVILKLSDAFPVGSEPDIEVTVTMININYGHNIKLLEACKPLKEYSLFVENIRMNKKKTDALEEAIDIALDELPDEAIIKPFLLRNKEEVKVMCFKEYDEERTYAERLEEGIAIGKEEGRADLREEKIAEMRAKGYTEEQIKDIWG